MSRARLRVHAATSRGLDLRLPALARPISANVPSNSSSEQGVRCSARLAKHRSYDQARPMDHVKKRVGLGGCPAQAGAGDSPRA